MPALQQNRVILLQNGVKVNPISVLDHQCADTRLVQKGIARTIDISVYTGREKEPTKKLQRMVKTLLVVTYLGHEWLCF